MVNCKKRRIIAPDSTLNRHKARLYLHVEARISKCDAAPRPCSLDGLTGRQTGFPISMSIHSQPLSGESNPPSSAFAKRKRILLIALILLAVIGIGVALAGWRIWGQELLTLFRDTLTWIRSLGAGPYFMAYAILPSFGVPISVFNLSAGPLFGPVIGLPWVLTLAGLCLAFNIALSYIAARWLLRPWAMRLCRWLGYDLPEVRGEGSTSLVTLVRFTPGPPYILQNLLLGLASVPFWPYFFISWVSTYAYAFALIMFGDAVMQGKGGKAILGISLLIVLTIVIRILRKRISARRIQRERDAAVQMAAAGISPIDDTPPPTP